MMTDKQISLQTRKGVFMENIQVILLFGKNISCSEILKGK